jgi:hypothetical protein
MCWVFAKDLPYKSRIVNFKVAKDEPIKTHQDTPVATFDMPCWKLAWNV